MTESVTITLPTEVRQSVQALAEKEGISPDELIGQALREHLFSRQFRLLRDRLVPHARAQGVTTDEDVFKRLS